MKYKGLSVIIRSESEYEIMQKFLGQYLYINWQPQIIHIATAIVIHYDNSNELSIGSVGDALLHKQLGCRLVEFKDFFKPIIGEITTY